MDNLNHTYAVILAGGGGTRLWPKSRNKHPKQFLKLVGDETMLQVSVKRLSEIMPWDHFIVVTNKLYEAEVKKQLPQIPKENIISEPQKRDTALAMLVGSLYAKKLDPQAVVINVASDHIVPDVAEYLRVMKAAVKTVTENKYLLSVGITPTHPATGFGYIKIGDELSQVDENLPLYKVASFTEKPDEQTAQKFIDTGKYFWNANMYVWTVETLTEAFAIYMPEIYQLTQDLPTKSFAGFHQSLAEIYDKAQSISIDYAISEKAQNLVLIPGDFGWDDVGSWQVVHDLGNKDNDNNVVISDSKRAQALTIDAKNNLLHTNGRLIAVVGVDDLVIIDTDEILMIAPKDRSQEVKKLVNRLKEEGKKEYL